MESASGRPIEYRERLLKLLKKAFGRGGRQDGLASAVTPYALRQTTARELRRHDVGGRRERVGHRGEAKTEVYAECSVDYPSTAAEAMEFFERCKRLRRAA